MLNRAFEIKNLEKVRIIIEIRIIKNRFNFF